jgi:hypothetical protein
VYGLKFKVYSVKWDLRFKIRFKVMGVDFRVRSLNLGFRVGFKV